jgi:hypothetical protein
LYYCIATYHTNVPRYISYSFCASDEACHCFIDTWSSICDSSLQWMEQKQPMFLWMRRRQGGLYKENCPGPGNTPRWFDWENQDRLLWYAYVNLYEKLHPLNLNKDKQIVIVNKLPFRGRIIYVISYFDCILIKLIIVNTVELVQSNTGVFRHPVQSKKIPYALGISNYTGVTAQRQQDNNCSYHNAYRKPWY